MADSPSNINPREDVLYQPIPNWLLLIVILLKDINAFGNILNGSVSIPIVGPRIAEIEEVLLRSRVSPQNPASPEK